LPEAQLDRFLLRVASGYPTRADEWDVLQRRLGRGGEQLALKPVVDGSTVLAMQAAVEKIHVAEPVGFYMVDVVAATRQRPDVQIGASPRGTLALMLASRARAALAGRDFVTPDDVKAMAVAVLGHRLSLRPDLWVRGVRGQDIVAECLARVPTPDVADVLARPPGPSLS